MSKLTEAYDISYTIAPKYAPGYLIRCTTWENDGDNYSTQAMDGIESVEDKDFLVALASKFCSTNSKHQGMGNEEHDHYTLCEVINDLLEEHPGVSASLRDELLPMLNEESEGEVQDWLDSNLLGSPVDYDHGFCRVIEYVEVHFVQDPIIHLDTIGFR